MCTQGKVKKKQKKGGKVGKVGRGNKINREMSIILEEGRALGGHRLETISSLIIK